jgi:hypothetical protein
MFPDPTSLLSDFEFNVGCPRLEKQDDFSTAKRPIHEKVFFYSSYFLAFTFQKIYHSIRLEAVFAHGNALPVFSLKYRTVAISDAPPPDL